MADEIKLLNGIEKIPEFLEKIVENNGGVSVLSGCPTDTGDCTADNPSCTSDSAPCVTDSSCYTDVGCTSDCTDKQPENEWYAVKITADGISTMSIAYYDPDGDRIPSSGYDEYSFAKPQTFYVKAGKNLYIYKITGFDDSYGLPWSFEINGDTGSSSRLNENGKTTTVNNSIFPESYCQITISATPITLERPDDWSWWSTIKTGSPIAITAKEWNAFCTRIDEFREYDELSPYPFTSVSKGTLISAEIVNEARSAIGSISGHGTLPSKVSSGDAITASFFNALKTALNSIP